jgi:alpha-1,6-mannosyltransferase
MQYSLAFGILLETIYLVVASASDYRANLLPFFALSLGAAAASLVFARTATPRQALAWGALFRATLLLRAPDLSEDLYRYAWDGHVAAAGVSAYAYAPDDPALASLRNDDWARSAHRDARTVYPPAAQAIFLAAAKTGRPRMVLKTAFAAADLAIVWLLLRFPGGAFAAALYAAFPLAVVESAGMGHLDSAGIALLLAALLLLRSSRPVPSGVGFALSVMTKYFTGFAFLPFLRRGRAPFFAAALLAGTALWAAGARGGASPASGLGNFATRWSGNSVVYPAVETAVDVLGVAPRAKAAYARWKSTRPERPWMERPWGWFYPELVARVVLALLLGAGLVVIAIRLPEPAAAAGASLALFLLLSPVLHPWYALWILPFAALRRSAAFLYLAAAVPFGYGLLHPVAPFSPGSILALEYVPTAALLLLSARRRPRPLSPIVETAPESRHGSESDGEFLSRHGAKPAERGGGLESRRSPQGEGQ